MNRRINQIVHFAIIVPMRKIIFMDFEVFFFNMKILTKRRANSRTRPAVSTQIKTFPSRLIVSKIVAKRFRKKNIEIKVKEFILT